MDTKSKKKLNAQAQEIVETVIARCKKETYMNQTFMKAEDFVERSSYYTGLSLDVIKQINNKLSNGCPYRLQVSDRLAIAKILKKIYTAPILGEITYKDLHKLFALEVREQKAHTLKNYEEFSHALSDAGYRKVQTVKGGRNIIMECPKVTFERSRYLQKITKARSLGKEIYYLDVRRFDETEGSMVPLEDVAAAADSPGTEEEMIMYYVISRHGYKNGLFCFGKARYADRLDSRLKWILHILIPLLEPSSVLVINERSFLANKSTKRVTEYDSKNVMMSWLKNRNMPCNPDMHKAELYELIEKSTITPEENGVDSSILKAYGHEVLRLPDKVRELNPTVQFWRDINHNIGKHFKKEHYAQSTFVMDLKVFINEQIQSIPPEKWNVYEDAIIHLETEFAALDLEIEDILDKIEVESSQIIDFD